jgi:1-phosphofructokinase family hexose kinase
MNKIFTVTLNPAIDREFSVPVIAYDQVLRSRAQSIDFGGKGFNVSRMLKSLGTSSTAIGFVGGRSGELLDEGLHSLGIETDFVWIEGETRTNVSIQSTAENHYIKVNEPGPTITEIEQKLLIDKITNLSSPGDWWVLAGSIPPGVSMNYYAWMITIIKAKGAKVILDSSGKALAEGYRAHPFMIKPNNFELRDLSEMPVDSMTQIVSASKVLQDQGVKLVVISLGDLGAVLLSAKEAWFVKSPTIKEVNPTGAGDSLVGGMVWAFEKDFQLVDALRWGVACGAAAASLNGTAVGSYQDIKALFEKTEAQQLIL